MNTNKKYDIKSNTTEQELKGIVFHLIITACVSAIVTAVNLIFCPVFLWFFFPVTGMAIGLAVHYSRVRMLLLAPAVDQN